MTTVRFCTVALVLALASWGCKGPETKPAEGDGGAAVAACSCAAGCACAHCSKTSDACSCKA